MSNELTTLLIAYPAEARSYECTRTEQRHSSQGAHGSTERNYRRSTRQLSCAPCDGRIALGPRSLLWLVSLISNVQHCIHVCLCTDDVWRKLRKGAHTILTPQAAARHLPIQYAEATQLMYELMNEPEVCLPIGFDMPFILIHP